VKGLRKLANYQNKLAEYNSWRRRASPEDIEYQEIEIGKSGTAGVGIRIDLMRIRIQHFS
jgi:hypothetical protein